MSKPVPVIWACWLQESGHTGYRFLGILVSQLSRHAGSSIPAGMVPAIWPYYSQLSVHTAANSPVVLVPVIWAC